MDQILVLMKPFNFLNKEIDLEIFLLKIVKKFFFTYYCNNWITIGTTMSDIKLSKIAIS